jgi:hypothetical protein
LEDIQKCADRAFLALPKYRLLRVFLKYEPAAATDMLAGGAPPSRRGYLPPVPLIRMVYEANPAAISSVSGYGLPLHQCSVDTNTIDSVRYVYYCIQRLPLLKDPGYGRQFCTLQQSGRLENIRLATATVQRISVKFTDPSAHIHS